MINTKRPIRNTKNTIEIHTN